MKTKYIHGEIPRLERGEINEKDGMVVNHEFDYKYSCDMCELEVTGLSYYRPTQQFKILKNKSYCFSCYPKAVDLYLADLKLKAAEEKV